MCVFVFLTFCWKFQSWRFFLALFYSQSWCPLLMFKVLKTWMAIIIIHGRWNFCCMRKICERLPQENFATKNWIWRYCFWRRHFWTLFIHEKKQIGSSDNSFKCYWFLLHHVARVKTTKDAWDNLCATFERRHASNKL